MAKLQLSFLGSPEVRLDGELLTFSTRKTLALLVYLAVEKGRQPREKLMALLWPENDEKRGRGALRITLLYLRRALDAVYSTAAESYLEIEPDRLGFNFNAAYTLDIETVTSLIGARGAVLPAAIESALANCRGTFLEGFSLSDAPEFEEWVTVQREHLHQQVSRLFDLLSRRQLESRLIQAGIDTAVRWITHDSLNETAHQRLMTLHMLAGSRTAALEAFENCRRLLERELGIQPSAETRTLAAQINTGKLLDALPNIIDTPSERQLPFVGRSQEYNKLAARFHETARGIAQVAVIEGEPGIGKTRLAAEILNWFHLQKADILQGRAFEMGGRLSYQPLVEAVRGRIDRENAPEDLLSDVWLTELSRLLPELRDRYLDLPLPAADETIAHTRLLEAVARLGEALTQKSGRLVLFIDDIQWADTASLDMLHYCLRSWSEKRLPVMCLLTLRQEALASDPYLADWMLQLGRFMSVQSIPLGPIDALETAELVEALAKQTNSILPRQLEDGDFARWLFQETAGQPFFIRETLNDIYEQGQFVPDIFSGTGEAVLPGIRRLIVSRLQRLSPEAINLLTAAATIGRPCSFIRLCRVSDLVESVALPALETLLKRRLIVEKAGSERPYTVGHDKIRDVVYAEAGEARRRLLHSRALAVLEAEQAPAAELAHHAQAAFLFDAVVQYSLSAGDAAMSLFAIRDAAKHYEKARSFLNSKTNITEMDIQRLYLNLSRAYELLGELDQAETVARELLVPARERQDMEMLCAAYNRQAGLAIYTHQLEKAAYLLQEVIQAAESHHLTHWLVQAEWSMAQLTHHQYDMLASKEHSQRALSLARELGDRELIVGTLNNLAYAHMLTGQLETAEPLMKEAHQLNIALGNRSAEADCLTAVGGIHIFQAKSHTAIPLIQNALNIYLEIENPWGCLFSSGWLAAGLIDTGQFEEALAVSLKVADRVLELGTTPVSIWNRLWIGNSYRALRMFDLARESHWQAAELNQSMPLPAFAEYIAAELCADYVFLNDLQAANRCAHEALSWRQYKAIPQIVLPFWAVTAALLRGGDEGAAREDIRRNGERFMPLPRFRIAHLRSLSALAQWEGDYPAAVSHLEAALVLAGELDLTGEKVGLLSQKAELLEFVNE